MKQVKVKVNYTDNFREKYTRAVAKAVRIRNEQNKDSSSDYRDTRAVCHADTHRSGVSAICDSSNN